MTLDNHPNIISPTIIIITILILIVSLCVRGATLTPVVLQ